jgi:hypothetical protein
LFAPGPITDVALARANLKSNNRGGNWQDEIRALSLAVSLWDAVGSGGGRLSSELKAVLVRRELPLAVQRALHVTDDDPTMTALSAIQRQTDASWRHR